MTFRFLASVSKASVVPIAMVLASAIGLAGLSRPAPASGLVATMFPPWWSGARAIEAAASVGSVAATGAVPFVLVIAPIVPEPAQELRRVGAWLVFDPRLIAICGTSIAGGPKP